MNACWLLCTERTGSTYLSDLLNSTCIWGDKSTNDPVTDQVDRFTEYYCDRFFKKDYLIDLPRFNKMTWNQFINRFPKDFSIESYLPDVKFVRIKRQNSVAVAVSLYIARRFTGWLAQDYGFSGARWNVHDSSVLEKFTSVEISINQKELHDCLLKAKQDQFLWDNYLRSRDFMDIEYQDVLNKPVEIVHGILNYIGAEGSPDLSWSKLPMRMYHPIKPKLTAILRKMFL
jgi:LPS sulfotransferase NodH